VVDDSTPVIAAAITLNADELTIHLNAERRPIEISSVARLVEDGSAILRAVIQGRLRGK